MGWPRYFRPSWRARYPSEGAFEGPHRHRNRPCRGRRSCRPGIVAGAGRRWRDAQSRGALAGSGRARQRDDLGGDPAAVGRDLRAETVSGPNRSRVRPAGSRMGRPARGGERQPLRGGAVVGHDTLRRARPNSRCCWTAGATRAKATGRSRWSRARRGSANRAFCRRCASALRTSRISQCATNARRITSTTPFILYRARSGMRRPLSAANWRRRGSTSWRR